MATFAIDVREEPLSDGTHRQGVALTADNIVFTRLIRSRESESDDYLCAPPAQLAFWLVDNWWRLRWECTPAGGMTPAWRLAHELASIGGGYIWPRLSIWGEDGRIGLVSRSDPPGVVGPVRYLTDALMFVPAGNFETEVDSFLSNALDMYSADSADRTALRQLIQALRLERDDPAVARWPRMEARLSFDPDDAPDATMEALAQFAEKYGDDAIEEAGIAAPGARAAEILAAEIDVARASRVECSLAAARETAASPKVDLYIGRYLTGNGVQIGGAPTTVTGHAGTLARKLPADKMFDREPDITGYLLVPSAGGDVHSLVAGDLPWIAAVRPAETLRSALGVGRGPLRNQTLADLLQVRVDVLQSTAAHAGHDLPYGLRLGLASEQRDRIALRSRWSHDRRFEMARALGDAIWAPNARLGPIATSHSVRQKFQRGFAQNLLCPYDDLVAYVGTDAPSEGDLSAAARQFHVSERVVRMALANRPGNTSRVNQQDLDSERFGALVDAA